MRYQSKNGCGAAAVVNALRALGTRITDRKARKLAGTNGDGTNQEGIITAIRAMNYTATEYKNNERNSSWRWLQGSLVHGNSVILCVDGWQHWAAVIGCLGSRVILVDSTRTKANMDENGVHVLSSNWLMRRWRNGQEQCRYYGISVGKQ